MLLSAIVASSATVLLVAELEKGSARLKLYAHKKAEWALVIFVRRYIICAQKAEWVLVIFVRHYIIRAQKAEWVLVIFVGHHMDG